MKKVKERISYGKKYGVIVSLCILMGIFAACNSNTEEIPEESVTEVATEEVVASEISEEMSETVSEETSESVSEEIANEVEYTNFASTAELMTYLEELNKTVIVDYNFSEGTEQVIIPNGGKYTLEGDDSCVSIFSNSKSISDIKTNVAYISAQKSVVTEGIWKVFIDTTGTDLEVPFTVVYEDGTEEDFIIYITKE